MVTRLLERARRLAGAGECTDRGWGLDSGHYLVEEQPEEILHEFLRFFHD